MDVGKALRFYRLQQGVTQDQLADGLGIQRQSYNMYESGRRMPSIYKCYDICNYLGITLDALMDKAKEF